MINLDQGSNPLSYKYYTQRATKGRIGWFNMECVGGSPQITPIPRWVVVSFVDIPRRRLPLDMTYKQLSVYGVTDKYKVIR